MSPLPSLPSNLVPSVPSLPTNQVTERFGEINNQIGSRVNNINRVTERLSVDAATKKAIIDRTVDQVVDSIPPTPSGSIDIEALDVEFDAKVDTYKKGIKFPTIPVIPQVGLLSIALRALPKITIPSPADFIEAKDLLIERLKEEQQKQSIAQLTADAKAQERPFTARLNAEARESADTNSVVVREVSSFVTSSL